MTQPAAPLLAQAATTAKQTHPPRLTGLSLVAELARCDREIADMWKQEATQPAYLTTLGIFDWEHEKRILQRMAADSNAGGGALRNNPAHWSRVNALHWASLVIARLHRSEDIQQCGAWVCDCRACEVARELGEEKALAAGEGRRSD